MENENSVLSDNAINNSSQDELRREHFVMQVVNCIKNSKDDDLQNGAISIAINGGWGEGKTSIKNLIKEQLKENEKYKFIEYESWKSKNKYDLYDNLFLEIFNKINIKDIEKNNKANSFKNLEKFKEFLIKIFNFVCNYYMIFITFVAIFILSFFIPQYKVKCTISYDIYGFYYRCNDNWWYFIQKIHNFIKNNLLTTEFLTFIISVCVGGAYSVYKLYQNHIDKKDFIKTNSKRK